MRTVQTTRVFVKPPSRCVLYNSLDCSKFAGILAPEHLETAEGLALAEQAGNVLVLLLIHLLNVLWTLEHRTHVKERSAAPNQKRVSKAGKHEKAQPTSGELPKPEDEMLVLDSSADVALTTTSNISDLIGEPVMFSTLSDCVCFITLQLCKLAQHWCGQEAVPWGSCIQFMAFAFTQQMHTCMSETDICSIA